LCKIGTIVGKLYKIRPCSHFLTHRAAKTILAICLVRKIGQEMTVSAGGRDQAAGDIDLGPWDPAILDRPPDLWHDLAKAPSVTGRSNARFQCLVEVVAGL